MGPTVGLLHPGEMGAAVGASARAAGADVVFASEGRSERTRARAEGAALRDVATLDALVSESDFVISVCPPANAVGVAREVAGRGYAGVYVDANAVEPAAARRMAEITGEGGARFVDGGIIGPPVSQGGATRLYLSGDEARSVAELFAASPLEAIALPGGPGAASALKMAFAAWTKGSAALLLAVRALARAEGVEAPLLAQWEKTHPQLAALCEGTARGTAPKAWRFEAEMEEIAATFRSADLPDGFHLAAAEVFARLADFKDGEATLEAVVDRLLRGTR